MKKLLPALLVLCSLCAAAQSTPEKLFSAYAEKGFIENKGQIRDFQGNPASQVKYLYNKGLANLQLRSAGFSYEIFSTAQDNQAVYESGNTTSDDMSDDFNTRIAGSSRIDVVLENANPSPKIYASDATGSYFNFYHSPVVKNHFEKVNSYNTITYQDIYPGIDLVFHAPDADTEEPLQYDFIVHPGADYRKIKLKYHGAAALQLAADGTVRAESGNGYVIEGKPVSFEGTAKKEILTAYNLAKNTISFQVGQYNTGETLVIDPTLLLGTYYGGANQEEVSKIELDSKSKFLVCGSTLSLTNIATAGAYQSTYGGGQADFFVAKFKTAGNLDWATYIGGTKKDQAYGVIADNNDNVVVVGKSESDGLATVGQVDQSGYGDAYVAKFSPAGLFLWGTYRGYKQDDHFRNVVGDKQGNLYCAGYTLSSSNMTTPGAWQTVYGGEGDCLLAKFKPDGNIAWCTYFGKEGADRLHAIHLDLANHLFVQGTTGSLTGMATPGVHQTTYGGGEEDMLLAQFDTSGVRIWSTYYGGEFSDRGRGVETDSAGNLYVAGLTTSATGISSPGAYKVNWTEGYYSGGSRAEDGYVAKFTSTGQRIWGTYYGSTGYDRIWGITLDRKTKSLYTVGGTSSETGISTPGGWQQNFSNFGVGEGFFSKWDYNGNLVWGSYVGSNGEEHVEDVALDKNGFIYVLSETDASLMPITLGTEQSSSNGQDEAVIYKFYTGLNCYDAYEPNDNFNAAKQVTQWLPSDSLIYGFNGAISGPSDEDWFKVKIKAANPNIMLVLTDLVKDYNLKLYNPQKVLMASSNNNGTTNDTIVYNNLVGGNYFIKISHTNAQWDSLNCYRLLTFKSPVIFPGRLDVNEFSATPDKPLNLKVFPNPADQLLTFNITADRNSLSEVWVYDMVGRLLLKKQISLVEGFQTLELPIGNLPMGSYKLLVKSESQHWIAGFVKQ